MQTLLLSLTASVVAYSLVSSVISRTVLTPPMLFVGIGVLLHTAGVELSLDNSAEAVEILAELTLVVLLFTDASRIDVRKLMNRSELPLRLLIVGMPLTMLLGAGVARFLLPDFSWWEAALLAAILAPTDAALGQAVVSNEAIPARIRQTINVESGLNDGIAVPFVMAFASYAAISSEAETTGHWLAYAATQITLGPIVGLTIGIVGGRLIEAAAKRGWMIESYMRVAGIALPLLAWSMATVIGGNGFIAAFISGLAIGCTTSIAKSKIQAFDSAEGHLMSLATFLLFGALFVVPAFETATSEGYLYAVLSFTVIRMIPVAISLIGAKVKSWTIVFLGWFGPRGLATLILALLVTNEHDLPNERHILTICVLTATLSVIAHGITALPGASIYSRYINRKECEDGCEHDDAAEHPLRFAHDSDLSGQPEQRSTPFNNESE